MSHHPPHAGEELTALDELLAGLAPTPEHLLPFLHRVQERLGHISPAAIRYTAHAFNLSRADVYGVVTFYGDFREHPVGRTVVQLCMAEACQSVGCRELAAAASAHLGVGMGESTPDGRVHLEAVYCLGNCALGPAVRIGDRVHGRVSPARLSALVAEAVAERSAPAAHLLEPTSSRPTQERHA